jgi:hypothetical protein
MPCKGESNYRSISESERTVRTEPFVSSDVLSQNRVNVSEEKSERVIWYKVRRRIIIHSVHVSHAKPDPDVGRREP